MTEVVTKNDGEVLKKMQVVEIMIDGQIVAREVVNPERSFLLSDKLQDVSDNLKSLYKHGIPMPPWGWYYTMETRPAKEGEFRAGYESGGVFAVAGPCALDGRIIVISDSISEKTREMMIHNANNNRRRIKDNERCEQLTVDGER